MDSEAYWAKRSEEREAAWQLKSRETLEKELAAYYEASLDHIQRNIDALYGRFAKDNALPMEEARKLLTGKEYRTWRMSLEEYVAQIDAGDKMLERELNTLAMRSRISRLDKLYSETLMELDGLGRKMRDRMDGFLGDAYKDNYYRGLYEIGHVGKTLPAISQVDSKSVEAVLRTPWSGKNYSARIWKNQKQLAQVIQDEVVASVHRGDDVRKISRRVADKMGVGLSNAQRLVRTELNYVHNQAALDSIRDAEMDYFRFVATLDSRTSTMCREHDGNIYPIDDADTGENIPPLHPRCRSIIVGSLGGRELKGQTRIAKGDEGKYIHVPAEMTYEDFQAVYVEKEIELQAWREREFQERGRIKVTPEKNDFVVNKKLMDSKAYHDKFENLTPYKSTNEALYAESIKILNHRNGTEYEDIKAIDSVTGVVLQENLTASGIHKHVCGFTKGQEAALTALGRSFDLLHNHPGNSLPSLSDIEWLFKRTFATASNVICHDGTVYRIVKLKELDNIDNKIDEVYNEAKVLFPLADHLFVEKKAVVALIKMLEKQKSIVFEER